MRPLRFVPTGSLVEVTCRTVQGRLLLRPSPYLRALIIGILARARGRSSGIRLHAFVFLSNHFHLLVTAESALALAEFMCYVNSNIAREAGRLYDWHEKFWGRRYQAILISAEEAAQVGRLEYLLSHGCKEGLVLRPAEWPGAHCIDALLRGTPLIGRWIDRSGQCLARRRGQEAGDATFSSEEILTLDPMPCWAHLPQSEIGQRVQEILARIEQRTARELSGKEPLGADTVGRQNPHQQPVRMERSPAPLVHAASRTVRLAFRAAYRDFVRAFRNASEKLRRGDPSTTFPPGSFPPRLPYVPDFVPA